MAKDFFEVFPTLKLSDEINQMMSDLVVERISTNRDHSVYRVYIHGNRLIPKKYIFQLERDIKDQIFRGKDIAVKVRERYDLSAQYTAKNLLAVYLKILRV